MLTLLTGPEVCCQNQNSFQCNNATIAYRTFGNGKPLVIINGGPGMNSDGFVGLAKKLSTRNFVILYDQRGTGKSTLSRLDASTITMSLMVNDLECLRQHLKLETWSVLGHSFGGMLASYYATLHPGRIESMILSASGGIDLDLTTYVGNNIQSKLTRQQADSLDYWQRKIIRGDTSRNTAIRRANILAHAYVFKKSNVPVIAKRLLQGNNTVNSLVWQDLRRIDFSCADQLASFKSPVLIIQGKQDIIEEKTALKAAAVLRNATLVLLANCGHYGWLDTPEDYFAALEKFLRAREVERE
jgi:proline iminopeptidase